jgi:GDP-4-dehydro-6-deoxy-D-mannose reductase
MNVLITGAAGFIGSHLTRYAQEVDASVLGLSVLEPATVPPGTQFERVNVLDFDRMSAVISQFRPDCIFHLAAQSYPTVSLTRPRETMEVNASGTINVFEAVRKVGISPVVVVACSSAEYGPVSAVDLPVKETHPLRPLHAYGVSKVAQDLLAAQYFANYSIPTVRIRIFNTTGPGKVGDVCSDLTRRVAEIEMGAPPRLLVGNLTTRRAILDVRDLVRGLWVSAQHCEPGEVYNVSSRGIYSVSELIEAIRRESGVEFEVEQYPPLMRSCDEPVIAGDTTKFELATGWKQECNLIKTLGEMLAWWRRELDPALASTVNGEDSLRRAGHAD